MFRIGEKLIESNLAEKDLGVLVEKLDVSQQCVLTTRKAKCILSCIKETSGQQGEGDDCPHG